VHIHFEEPN